MSWRTIESLTPGRQSLWRGLQAEAGDITLLKNRYSAFTPGSSALERTLRSIGLENVLVAGMKTNVCCESTARDAMMLDFRTVMVSDCCAALSQDEHRATLETFIQQFGDMLTSREALDLLAAAQA